MHQKLLSEKNRIIIILIELKNAHFDDESYNGDDGSENVSKHAFLNRIDVAMEVKF